ncbi:MAG: hypothetical protein ACRDRG_08365 [Pseudonocardiaceae bacterium]
MALLTTPRHAARPHARRVWIGMLLLALIAGAVPVATAVLFGIAVILIGLLLPW